VADLVRWAAHVLVHRTEKTVNSETPEIVPWAPGEERDIVFGEPFRPETVKRGEETCPSFFWRNHETFPGRTGGTGAPEEIRTGNRGC